MLVEAFNRLAIRPISATQLLLRRNWSKDWQQTVCSDANWSDQDLNPRPPAHYEHA